MGGNAINKEQAARDEDNRSAGPLGKFMFNFGNAFTGRDTINRLLGGFLGGGGMGG
jgi:hypothetical protein